MTLVSITSRVSLIMVTAIAATHGAVLNGIVAETGEKTVRVTLEGEIEPGIGDSATIYFNLPGVEDEVIVATGKVAKVEALFATIAIEERHASPEKGHLVKIRSANPQPKQISPPSPVASATPSPTRGPVYTPPPDYVPKLDLAVQYPCDEGSGDTLTDTSNGRPMKLYGGLGFSAGKSGKALNFRDSAKLFARRESDDPILNFAGRDFRIELDCNFRMFAHEQVLLEKFSGKAGPGWTLTVLDKTKLHFFSHGAGAFTAAVNLKPNQWYRLAVERRGERLQMIVGDAVVLDQPMQGAITPSPNPLLLGRRNEQDGRGFPMNGLIDEVRIAVASP